jgi:SPP1 family predicted phage head-tail adaptor
MQAGPLRHSVSLLSPAGTQDSYGQPSSVYSTEATVRAAIEPLNGRELFQAQQVGSDISHRVTIRGVDTPSGLKASWRVAFGSRTFEVESIKDDDERGFRTELMCVERTT